MKSQRERILDYPAEEWRQFRKTSYKISNRGNVIGLKGRLMKPQYYGRARKYYCFLFHGKLTAIHQAVAESFLGPRPKGLEINHKNGIGTDNRPENLEYVTHQQNCQHAYDIGIHRHFRGEKNVRCKLSDSDVIEIREIWASGKMNQKAISKKFKISPSEISRYINRKRSGAFR